MRFLSVAVLACMVLTGPGGVSGAAPRRSSSAKAQPPEPALVRVRIATSDGVLVIALDSRRAPLTTANFLAYVDDGRFDGTTFYRAARNPSVPTLGFVQGGIGTDARRMLPPVPMETTAKTGIHHDNLVVSMAHGPDPNGATGNFTIALGPAPSLDAHGGWLGYAAFGHLVSGMDTVKRILAESSGGGSGPMRGQMILKPVKLISARRLDGAPRPTGMVKPWLLGIPSSAQ